MTEKQRLFVEEYVKDLNATRAYMAVYKNVKSYHAAGSASHKLLKKADIQAYKEELLEKIHDEKTADAKEVIEYITAVMRGASKSSVLKLIGEGVQDVVDKPPDEKERLKAAELLGKYYGIFTEKQRTEVVVPVFEGEDEIKE